MDPFFVWVCLMAVVWNKGVKGSSVMVSGPLSWSAFVATLGGATCRIRVDSGISDAYSLSAAGM